MSVEKGPGKWVRRLLLMPIRTFIERRSNVVIERNDTINMEGPYVLLSNHVNNWDPLFLNSYVSESISFIAADQLFRNPFLKHVLNFAGAIPKQKFRNDTTTIRNILRAKKQNRVIGIFPEGNRNWDGETEPLIKATSKLVKLLDIPVVVATIRGGHLSHPRWGDGHRKGTIALSFVKMWDVGAFRDDHPETVHAKLSEALHYNEMAWQSEHMISYKSKTPAHYLERLLFICPNCHTPGQLYSHADSLECGQCGSTVRFTDYGTFEPLSGKSFFATPQQWNKWQLHFLKKSMKDPDGHAALNEAMHDHVKLYISNGQAPFKLVSPGQLTWDAEKVNFAGDNDKQYTFSINKMEGLNIQFHHKLDFYHDETLVRLLFYQPRTSAYKWLNVIKTKQTLDAEHAGKEDMS